MERIKMAALRKDGKVYTDKDYGLIFKQATTFGGLRYAEQGFVTNKGRFVDRFEGLKIAKKAKQINFKYKPEDRLISEDYRLNKPNILIRIQSRIVANITSLFPE